MNKVLLRGHEPNEPAVRPLRPSEAPEAPAGVGLPTISLYLAILRRRKWVIAATVAIALIAAMIITVLMTPLYTAHALIEVQRESANIVNVEDVQSEAATTAEEFYQTQYALLKARSLAERVARDLRLYQDPAFLSAFDMDDALQGTSRQLTMTEAQRQQRIKAVAGVLLQNIDIEPVKLSQLIDVSFTSPDPKLSAKIVDAWTRNFVEGALERRYEATSYARRFLEQRLAQLKAKIEASERQLVGYAAREGIINVTSAGEDGKSAGRPLVVDQVVGLNNELQEAVADRISAQSRMRAGGSSAASLNNAALTGLRQKRADAAAEYSKLLVQFEPGYPPAQALAAQLRQLDAAIATEERRVESTASNEFRSASAREAALSRKLEDLKSDLLSNRTRSIQYNIFERDVDTNRQLYDALLQRYKEIGVAGGIGVNNISVVDSPDIPSEPSSPNLLLNLLIALIGGTVIAAGIAFALEQVDEAIADPSEIPQTLGLPLLGIVPKAVTGDVQEELRDRKSAISESMLSIQTSLEFSTEHGLPRSLMVTSTRPSEGKSTTSFALAESLARTDQRVILVDGDMRSPSLHRMLDVPNSAGLSNYLAGDDGLEKLIHRGPARAPAWMTAGPPPPNAAELLTGGRLAQLLEALSANFDVVVIDAPPVMGLADAPLLATRVEGAVYVIESHATRLSMARIALARLRSAQVHLIGCVLTKFEAKRAHYGYGYDYGYGYGNRDLAPAES